MKAINIITFAVLVVGGINWGLVELFDFNLVDELFGATGIDRLVYVLVGLSAL